MFEIVKRQEIAPGIYEMIVEAPYVARACEPGQFLIVRAHADGERVPLTICDYDREKGTLQIVFQVVGAETYKMSLLREGDAFADIVGPLGRPSDLLEETPEALQAKKILFIAGGVGTAPVYPQLKWLKERGITADCILGAKNRDFVILEDMISAVSNLYITTDDGSYGRQGMVTKCLEDLWAEGKRYDHCVSIGPMIMMKFVCQLTEKLGIPTVVSMNPVMVDGTGMCGACCMTVGGEVKFACVDGPEFDGHKVDFDQAMARSRQYKEQEERLYALAKGA